MSRTSLAPRAAALGAAAGGILIAMGAVLPWITLYGGLHPLRGILGIYGQVLFAGGLGCMVGALFLARSPRRGGPIVLAVAAAMLAFAAWLAFNRIPGTLAQIRENPFLVAAQGTGPYVAMLGTLLALVAGTLAVRVPSEARRA